jgi:hypothetical protein
MARGIAVQIHRGRPSKPIYSDGLAEKLLRRIHAAIRTQQRSD